MTRSAADVAKDSKVHFPLFLETAVPMAENEAVPQSVPPIRPRTPRVAFHGLPVVVLIPQRGRAAPRRAVMQ